MFDDTNPLRIWAHDLVTSTHYDYAMLVLIMINCILMAMESPRIKEGSPLALLLYWSDVGFTIIFGVEVVLKSLAFTFTTYMGQLTNAVSAGVRACVCVLDCKDNPYNAGQLNS